MEKKLKSIGLVPLRNFATIDKGHVHRSAQPESWTDYKWLRDVLGIKFIINLRAESNHDSVYASKFGIKVINIPVKDHSVPSLEQAKEFIKFVRKHKGPMLIHCEHGHGRTSIFCVLTRLALGWKLNKALKEELNKYHYNFRHDFQKEWLVNNFDKKAA